MSPNKIPTLQELEKYNVNRPGAVEAVRQSLYDFQTYPSGGVSQLTFFQLPVGQAGKTLADTNMEAAGSLPSPKRFLIQSIEVFIIPDDDPGRVANDPTLPYSQRTVNDTWIIGRAGYLKLFIGSKDYLTEAPIGRFPPKTHFALDAALADSTTAAATKLTSINIGRWSGRPYMLSPEILLQPTQNFNVTLNWPVAIPLSTSADARVGVILDGILYRNSQ